MRNDIKSIFPEVEQTSDAGLRDDDAGAAPAEPAGRLTIATGASPWFRSTHEHRAPAGGD